MATSKKKPTNKSSKKVSPKKKSNTTLRKKKVIRRVSTTKPPSQVFDEVWVAAERKKGTYPELTANSGKWLIRLWKHNLDLVWEKIKTATENGLLGGLSKASTGMPSPLALKENLSVICIYTYDFTDKEDVMRIREELRKLGATAKISYKADSATRALQYSFNTKGRVSLYYE
jgi:hypothetical protein